MNAEEKQRYLKHYKEKKVDGELFFPHSIAKDAVVSLMVFVLLLGLVIFVGVPNEPPANPADSSYVPRPEWYFLWAFQLLKYFPGALEGVAILGLGLVIFAGLFGLPFFDRNPKRHPLNRPVASATMLLIVGGLAFLTVQAVRSTPPQAEGIDLGAGLAGRIEAGGKIYAEYCAECHGADGEGGEIKGQPGEVTNPLDDQDFLATHTAEVLYNVMDYGWQSLGMPPFGLKYGGQLTDPEMRAIADFMLAWYVPPEDETSETGGAATSAEDLAKIEAPSFAKNVKSILDKRCASCHSKRLKGDYSVADYDKFTKSGKNAPVITPGDAANSILIKMLRGVKTDAGGQMPPSKPLTEAQIQLIERWVQQGAQNN